MNCPTVGCPKTLPYGEPGHTICWTPVLDVEATYAVVPCPDYGRPFAVVDLNRDLVISKHSDQLTAIRAANILNRKGNLLFPERGI